MSAPNYFIIAGCDFSFYAARYQCLRRVSVLPNYFWVFGFERKRARVAAIRAFTDTSWNWNPRAVFYKALPIFIFDISLDDSAEIFKTLSPKNWQNKIVMLAHVKVFGVYPCSYASIASAFKNVYEEFRFGWF